MRSLILGAALLPSVALAGSIQSPGVIAGPDSGPATVDPAAVFYNPAAIAPAEGFHGMFDLQTAFVRVEATTTRNEGLDPNTGEAYDPAKANAIVPVGLIGATYKIIPKRLAVGFVVTQPFTGGGDYTAGEPDDEAPYTSHSRYAGIQTRVITLQMMPAVGVTIVDGVHVGAGAGFVFDYISVLQASDPFGTEGTSLDGSTPYANDTLLQASATGGHFAWNAGVFIDKFKWLQVGASFSGGGTFRAKGKGTVTLPEESPLANENYTGPVDALASFEMPLPAVVRVSVASEFGKFRVGAGYEYTYWNVAAGDAEGDLHVNLTDADGGTIDADNGVSSSVGPDIYSPRRLWNAANFNATFNYKPADRVEILHRLMYNQNAVPDYAVSPSNLDFTNIGGQLGVRVKVGGPVTLGLAYTKYFPLTREISTSAWDVRDAADQYYVDDRFSAKNPYKAGTNGTYSADVDIVGLRVQVDL